MTTMNHLNAAAEKLGATIDKDDIQHGYVYIDAPKGKSFAHYETDEEPVHTIRIAWETDDQGRPAGKSGQQDKHAAIAAALVVMKSGLKPCDWLPNCEVCNG